MITGILRSQQLKKAHAVTAVELMTSPAYMVLPEDTVEQAARLMYLRNVKRLPVVDAVLPPGRDRQPRRRARRVRPHRR